MCALYGDRYDDRLEDSRPPAAGKKNGQSDKRLAGEEWEPGITAEHKSLSAFQRELVEKRVEAERSREQLAAEKDRQKNAQADLKKELEDAQAAKAKAASLEAELKSVKEAAFSLEAELAEAKAARDAAEAKAAKLEADLNELLAH